MDPLVKKIIERRLAEGKPVRVNGELLTPFTEHAATLAAKRLEQAADWLEIGVHPLHGRMSISDEAQQKLTAMLEQLRAQDTSPTELWERFQEQSNAYLNDRQDKEIAERPAKKRGGRRGNPIVTDEQKKQLLGIMKRLKKEGSARLSDGDLAAAWPVEGFTHGHNEHAVHNTNTALRSKNRLGGVYLYLADRPEQFFRTLKENTGVTVPESIRTELKSILGDILESQQQGRGR